MIINNERLVIPSSRSTSFQLVKIPCMTNVRMLINQFQTAPCTKSVTKAELPLQTKFKLRVKEMVSLFDQMQNQDCLGDQAVKEEDSAVAAMPAKTTNFKCLEISTFQDQIKFDLRSTTTSMSMCCSNVPRSPSTCSCISTASLDSQSSIMDPFSPDLLQLSGEDGKKIPIDVESCSNDSLIARNLQSTILSKLVPKTSCCHESVSGKLLPSEIKEATRLPPIPAKLCRSLISATMAFPSEKALCLSSISTRSSATRVPSQSARGRRNSASISRYLNYDSSPRYAATKAINLERRYKLEKRNRYRCLLT
ncbi:uncharacterized protein PHALS_10980 [Plasmopara halstedii]|uniref:Uncharacterized protein n=1 Tax=Plasmopara halstedii TaxID=4781 RepID=A0A0P1AJK0_PLAHL|nr:uncharacterized protein PHALS_10980 [Plasmopara halstedii]CEG40797.1 hypothetical protein PHALS_10980 [Plasmopara halstedii]|eukprot:XP_024577166.1 hypothetical protein PHALS_10980 [Plasmopara halstedii]